MIWVPSIGHVFWPDPECISRSELLSPASSGLQPLAQEHYISVGPSPRLAWCRQVCIPPCPLLIRLVHVTSQIDLRRFALVWRSPNCQWRPLMPRPDPACVLQDCAQVSQATILPVLRSPLVPSLTSLVVRSCSCYCLKETFCFPPIGTPLNLGVFFIFFADLSSSLCILVLPSNLSAAPPSLVLISN